VNLDHDHPSFTTAGGGAHMHSLGGRNIVQVTGVGGYGWSVSAGGHQSGPFNTDDATHTHVIDVPALGTDNTLSDYVDPGDTHAENPGDTNTATATNNAVDPGDTNSTGAGTDNYHPYLAVNKIIKL
jgi:hypothetical protein